MGIMVGQTYTKREITDEDYLEIALAGFDISDTSIYEYIRDDVSPIINIPSNKFSLFMKLVSSFPLQMYCDSGERLTMGEIVQISYVFVTAAKMYYVKDEDYFDFIECYNKGEPATLRYVRSV